VEAEVGTRNLDDPLLYQESVKVQLEQMGDLGGSYPLPPIRPTGSDKLPNLPSPQFPLRPDLVLERLFRTPQQVEAQWEDRLRASGRLPNDPTNP